MKEEAPNYLINLIPKWEANTRTRNNSIPTFNCHKDYFRYSFFPSTLNDWLNLDLNIGIRSQIQYSKVGFVFHSPSSN